MWTVSLEAIAAICSAGIFLISFTWWFSGQFSKVRQQIYESSEKIIAKLEYHERHDDQRFSIINNDLWAIKLRNTSADDQAKRLVEDINQIKSDNKNIKDTLK